MTQSRHDRSRLSRQIAGERDESSTTDSDRKHVCETRWGPNLHPFAMTAGKSAAIITIRSMVPQLLSHASSSCSAKKRAATKMVPAPPWASRSTQYAAVDLLALPSYGGIVVLTTSYGCDDFEQRGHRVKLADLSVVLTIHHYLGTATIS